MSIVWAVRMMNVLQKHRRSHKGRLKAALHSLLTKRAVRALHVAWYTWVVGTVVTGRVADLRSEHEQEVGDLHTTLRETRFAAGRRFRKKDTVTLLDPRCWKTSFTMAASKACLSRLASAKSENQEGTEEPTWR